MATTPMFYLQIVDGDGRVATLPGGGRLEADLIELCVKSIAATQSLGYFVSQTAVEQAIRNGMVEAIRTLKRQTRELV